MIYVKSIINNETKEFVEKLRPDFSQHWKGPKPEARFLNVQDHAVCTTNAIFPRLL